MTADRAPLVEIIKDLWQDILDKDDRNSPSEYPDMALLTFREFEDAIRLVLDAIAEPTEAMKWAGTYKRMESRTEAATTDIWRTMFSALRKELTDD